MRQLKRELRFLKRALSINLKISLALRASFLLTLLITIIKHGLFLVIWFFFFNKYKTIHGWEFAQLSFMYGSVCIGTGFVEAFFYGLKELPKTIESGGLDVFLLQPKNILLNIAVSKGDIAAFGDIATGLILVFLSGYFSIKYLGMSLLLLFLSIVFVFALNIYLSSIAFFMKDAKDFIREITLNTIIVASNPNSAYQGLLKILTYTLLPVAFMSFFPIEYLRTGYLKYLWIATVGTFLFLAIACGIFYQGLKRYSSGNLINLRV